MADDRAGAEARGDRSERRLDHGCDLPSTAIRKSAATIKAVARRGPPHRAAGQPRGTPRRRRATGSRLERRSWPSNAPGIKADRSSVGTPHGCASSRARPGAWRDYGERPTHACGRRESSQGGSASRGVRDLRDGNSGDVSRRRAPCVGAHQLVPDAEARDALWDHRVRRSRGGSAPPRLAWGPRLPRRQCGQLVGEHPRAGIPGHRPVALRLLRLHAAGGRHTGRPGGCVRAAARPSQGRPGCRDRVEAGRCWSSRGAIRSG
jgi:hypothetical protein